MATITRRQAMFGGAAGVAALALGGCGDDGTGPSASTGTVRLYSDNPNWKDGFVQAGEELKRVCGFGFEPLSVPTTTEYQQVIRSSLQTPKTADVVKWWSGYRLQDLARTGGLTDLGSVWAQAEGKGWLTPELRDAYTYQGKVYGLPLYQSYWVVFYSKPLFDRHRLSVPTTWAQLTSNAATLKAAGVPAFATTQADGWTSFIPFQELVGKVDPEFYRRLTGGEAAYTDPTVRQAMSLWREWIDNGWVTKADLKMDDAAAQMKAGKLAMIPIGTWYSSAFRKAGMVSGQDYGAFLMPTVSAGTRPSVFVEGGALTVPASAPNHDAALKVLAAWLDPAVQKVWSAFLLDSSANPTVPSEDPVVQSVQQQIATTKPMLLNRYWEASPPALIEGNVGDLARFMLDPGTADSVLESMRKRADKEWSTWKQAG